jgi:CRISPR/Cas system CMR-associated protein Cmr1 (group 7 of RAMP superfamily)
METREMEIKLLSPCFCGGADQNAPEIRAPSIRGHVRRWHTQLYGIPSMQEVWGSVSGAGSASKIQLRVEAFDQEERSFPLLPHKQHGAGTRKGLSGGSFNILLASRDASSLKKAETVLQLWSLLGALGTRANRAAGSVWPVLDAPGNTAAFKRQLQAIGYSKGQIRIAKETGAADELRKAASDTLSVSHLFGSANPRKESPLKIKLVEFGDGLHLLLFAQQNGVIDSALQELRKRGKPLGRLTWESIW